MHFAKSLKSFLITKNNGLYFVCRIILIVFKREFIMKKTKSTFERVMADPKQKKAFEKEYANFLLSELLLDAMTRQEISVRALSRASGISTSVIQNLRAMQPVNITLKTLNALLSTLGYELVARKGRHCVNLSTTTSVSSTHAGA